MGARYCELWVKASDATAAVALAAEQERPRRGPVWPAPAAGAWACLWQRDFDSDVFVHPARPIVDRDLSARAEAIYLAMYDGPASELCGTFAYEHVVGGHIARKLVFAPAPDERLRWLHVQGEPEPWEAPYLSAQLDPQLARWREERTDHEVPPPTLAEEAAARVACLRFTKGEALPRLSEYALVGEVSRAFGLVLPPG